jgi:hypothetical protein
MSNPPSEAAPELSAEELALLSRVRRMRSEERAPEALRQRVLARAVAELSVPEEKLAVTHGPLVPIARPSLRLGLWLAAALALGLGLLVSTRVLLRKLSEHLGGEARTALGPEPRPTGDWHASGPAAELLAQSPLLRKPLLPLADGESALAGPSLFGDRPFSQQGRAWQVRRWSDPKSDPEQKAAFDFDAGALCVSLAAAERVIGGWPWPDPGVAAPTKVKLSAGQAYRLGFKAWVKGSLPSQLLIGVGHTQFPFVAAAGARVQVSGEPEPFAMDFVAQHDDESVGVAFLAANSVRSDTTRVCLSDMNLSAR